MKLTEKEMKLASVLLSLAADEFSYHCCNDIEEEWFKDWSKEELNELEYKICQWNNSPNEYDPEHNHFSDWILMGYLADKLETEP